MSKRAVNADALRSAARKAPVTDVLTVEEFCAELKVSKDTFYHWRKVGTAPVCHRLPNGELRISRADRDAWLAKLRDVA
jgi:predicted site-specific integrase-resolvase